MMLDAFLSRPDDLLAVMGMEHVNANEPDDHWCEEGGVLIKGERCDFNGPPHVPVDVFLRPRTEGGTE